MHILKLSIMIKVASDELKIDLDNNEIRMIVPETKGIKGIFI